MKIIDANYILRYLLEDIKEQYLDASKIIEKEIINIPDFIVAEVVYVLEKIYKVDRNLISSSLKELIDYENIILQDKYLIITALEIYAQMNVDFADTILLSYNKLRKVEIYTFDKKLLGFIKNS